MSYINHYRFLKGNLYFIYSRKFEILINETRSHSIYVILSIGNLLLALVVYKKKLEMRLKIISLGICISNIES